MPDGTPQGQEGDRIEATVRAVLSTMAGDLTAKESALLAELEGLGRTIARAKAEIAALKVEDIRDAHIPSATDELDAIVDHTAHATNEILDSCETLEILQSELSGDAADRLQGAVTRIYEACSFQDITGQRIGKVVTALKAIEGRISSIVSAASGMAQARRRWLRLRPSLTMTGARKAKNLPMGLSFRALAYPKAKLTDYWRASIDAPCGCSAVFLDGFWHSGLRAAGTRGQSSGRQPSNLWQGGDGLARSHYLSRGRKWQSANFAV
jgi:chemotaxis protein CheZ